MCDDDGVIVNTNTNTQVSMGVKQSRARLAATVEEQSMSLVGNGMMVMMTRAPT
jgi:hypothetical protein